MLVGDEVEDGDLRATLLESTDDLLPELAHAAGHDRDAAVEREEVAAHDRCASQTASQNSRTQPAPPGRLRTQRASGFTSGQASAGTTGSPTARRHSASLMSLPT